MLVPCLVSCSAQLSVPEPTAIEGLFPALPASGSWGTQKLRCEGFLLEGPGHFFHPSSHWPMTVASAFSSLTPAAAAPVRGSCSASPDHRSQWRAWPRSWRTAVPSGWAAGIRPALPCHAFTASALHASCGGLRTSPSSPSARGGCSPPCTQCGQTLTTRNMSSHHPCQHQTLSVTHN